MWSFKTDKQLVDPNDVAMMEDDLKCMHLSKLDISTNLNSGEIRVNSLEITDRSNKTKLKMVRDKTGTIRLYQVLPSNDRKPMNVKNWSKVHENMPDVDEVNEDD